MSMTLNPQIESDRVRRYTSPERLRQMEESLVEQIRFYSTQPEEVIARRIEELKLEWSMERYLQVNAASIGLGTTLMALLSGRKWLVLTCTALGFFMYHALQGFDPPLAVLRRLGVRTKAEIDREIYALKVVRRDFEKVPGPDDGDAALRAELALEAVCR